VTNDLVRVEIESFDEERCRQFTTLCQLVTREHEAAFLVLNHVKSDIIQQISLLVGQVVVLVVVAFLIRELDQIALLVSVKSAKDIILVEGSVLCIRWHLNKRLKVEFTPCVCVIFLWFLLHCRLQLEP